MVVVVTNPVSARFILSCQADGWAHGSIARSIRGQGRSRLGMTGSKDGDRRVLNESAHQQVVTAVESELERLRARRAAR